MWFISGRYPPGIKITCYLARSAKTAQHPELMLEVPKSACFLWWSIGRNSTKNKLHKIPTKPNKSMMDYSCPSLFKSCFCLAAQLNKLETAVNKAAHKDKQLNMVKTYQQSIVRGCTLWTGAFILASKPYPPSDPDVEAKLKTFTSCSIFQNPVPLFAYRIWGSHGWLHLSLSNYKNKQKGNRK